ncbi:MAG: AbrB/MazE/SpoVT family DNA-binding domain-containing protein [Patescibacteria group bacterium]|nr:AbrB/MazE/SpoVT family DNA-binding domain-containing protein [Patescibacteria group bacterium]
METTIQKWGNSLAVRIPSSFAKEIGLQNNLDVTIKIDSKKLVISPKKNELILKGLLGKINKSNLHEEIPVKQSLGKEIW